MTLSGIHDSDRLQSGFPIKIDSGMTMCESINNKRELTRFPGNYPDEFIRFAT